MMEGLHIVVSCVLSISWSENQNVLDFSRRSGLIRHNNFINTGRVLEQCLEVAPDDQTSKSLTLLDEQIIDDFTRYREDPPGSRKSQITSSNDFIY